MERKGSTKGLAKKELERLMDLSECAMFTAKKGPDIDVCYANKKFYSLLQYTQQEFEEKYGKRLMDVIVPEEKQKIRNLIARQAAAGGLLHLEVRVQRKDGQARWISMTAQTVTTEDGIMYYCSALDITKQKHALDEIYNAKREAELVTNSVPGGVVKICATDYTLLYANDGFYRLSGYSRVEYFSLFGNRCNVVLYEEDAPMVARMVRSAVENRGALSFEYRIVAKNGDIRWSYINGCRVDDHNGEPVYLCIIMDITSRKKLEQKMEDSVRRSKHLLEFMKETEWTYQIPEQKLYRSGYLKGTYSPEEEMDVTFSTDYLKTFIHPEDAENFSRDIVGRIRELGHVKGVYRMRDGMGNYHPCSVSMISVDSHGGKTPDIIYGETNLLEDNSYMPEQKKTMATLPEDDVAGRILNIAKTAKARFQDDVTLMMSYEAFVDEVQGQLKNRKADERYGLLCCDVNGFQKLTYHYGISIGDEVLKDLAKVLQAHMAYENICSRVSGDYFIVFFVYQSHGELLKKISNMLQTQTSIEEKRNYATSGTTSGIYLIQPEDSDVMDMLGKADLARRSIKGTRGNHYAIYTDALKNSRSQEQEIIEGIERSIEDHSIEICYLPRIRGDKENVIGCKAVPRVPLPGGNYLPLEELSRYVERSRAVQQLVFYVLSNVCNNLGAWKAGGKKILPVSLDVTTGQLCMQNAVNKIDEIVTSNKLEPKDIIFEIQEHYFSDLTTNFEMALRALSQKGYRIIISRFSSDHTAVHSLRRLPVAGIKFHGEYFRQNARRETERIIFSKIVEMVHELGLEVACGGIQTKLQEEIARSIGCNVFEGDIYYGVVRSDVYERCFLKE